MKLTILLVSTVLFWCPGPAPCQSNRVAASGCSIVEQALAAHRDIKPGMLRKDVEKNFNYDGGLNFPDHGRFTFRGCPSIKLEVEFEPAPDRGNALISPNDTVRTISKLFIDYPTTD